MILSSSTIKTDTQIPGCSQASHTVKQQQS